MICAKHPWRLPPASIVTSRCRGCDILSRPSAICLRTCAGASFSPPEIPATMIADLPSTLISRRRRRSRRARPRRCNAGHIGRGREVADDASDLRGRRVPASSSGTVIITTSCIPGQGNLSRATGLRATILLRGRTCPARLSPPAHQKSPHPPSATLQPRSTRRGARIKAPQCSTIAPAQAAGTGPGPRSVYHAQSWHRLPGNAPEADLGFTVSDSLTSGRAVVRRVARGRPGGVPPTSTTHHPVTRLRAW